MASMPVNPSRTARALSSSEQNNRALSSSSNSTALLTTSTAASIDSQYGFPVHVNPLLAAHTPWPPQQQRQHQQQQLLRQDLAALCSASPHAQLPARVRAALLAHAHGGAAG
jgi:hypothetical protein